MKLNQLIAFVAGKKPKIQQFLTPVHHGWHKDRISGINRTYAPLDETGEVFQAENRSVQVRVPDAIDKVTLQIADFMNIIATQEYSNTLAKADVLIDKVEILKDVPISALLFLEKQLIDLHTLAANLPTLSTDRIWTEDDARHCYVTSPEQTAKTNKKIEVIVKYEATKEHPAQTEMVSLDRTIGHWTTIHMSGALPEKERDAIVARIEALRDAVKIAREKANDIEVTFIKDFGPSVLDYIFKS